MSSLHYSLTIPLRDKKIAIMIYLSTSTILSLVKLKWQGNPSLAIVISFLYSTVHYYVFKSRLGACIELEMVLCFVMPGLSVWFLYLS